MRAVPLSVGDWIFTVLTWLLLALGVLGLAWALFWDRSRGRKRCPRCWYGLDGVPSDEGVTTCPECGKVVRKPTCLFRTRRRWGFATLAVFALFGSYVSYAFPIVRDHGWWRLAPDIALIAMVPSIERSTTLPAIGSNTNPLFNEVSDRVSTNPYSKHNAWWSTGGLWPWERWLLRRQSLALLEHTSRLEIEELAARMLAISTDDPKSLVALDRRATVILAWSKLRYETCETYVDVGVAVHHSPMMAKLGDEGSMLLPEFFLTSFERGVRIHQEVGDHIGPARAAWLHRASWRGPGGQAFHWANFDGGPQESPDYFGASPTTHVWDALDPTESWSSILDFFFGAEELVGVETIRGRPCYHVIEGGKPAEARIEVWIDRETGLVRQHYFGNTLFHYESALDVELDASWYAFDPDAPERSPLVRRLGEIDALLPEHDLLPLEPTG